MRKITFSRGRKSQQLKAWVAVALFTVLMGAILIPMIHIDDRPTIVDDPSSSSFGFKGNKEIDRYFDHHGDPSADGLSFATAYRFEDITFTCSLSFNSITRYVIIVNCTFVDTAILVWKSRNIYTTSCLLLESIIEIKFSEDISIMNNSLAFAHDNSESGPNAIVVEHSSSVKIARNTVEGASLGIHVSGSDSILVIENDLNSTGLAAIKLNSSELVSVCNNTIEGNGQASNGIYLDGSDFNNITLNKISRNLVGIKVDAGSANNTIAINWLIDNQQQISCDPVSIYNSWSMQGKALGNIYSDYVESYHNASFSRVDVLYPEYFPVLDYQDQAIFKGSVPYVINGGIVDTCPLTQLCNVSIEFSVDIINQDYLWGFEEPTIIITLGMPIFTFIGSIEFAINGSTPVHVDIGSIHDTEILIPINPTIWNALGSGLITISVIVETIFGAETKHAITIEKDISDPIISIINPVLNKWYGHSAIAYELAIIERNLNRTWYSVNGGFTKYAIIGTRGTLDQSVWTALPHGRVDIIFGAVDRLGNSKLASITVYKDMKGPDIVITSPNALQVINATAPTITLSIADPSAIAHLSYSIGGNTFTITPSTTSFAVNQMIWAGLSDGPVPVEICSVDEWGNAGTEMTIVQKDTVKPTIVLASPTNQTYFGQVAPQINAQFTDANFNSCSYSVGSYPHEYKIDYLLWMGQLNQTAWAAQPDGAVSVRFRAVDKAGNVAELLLMLGKDTVAPVIEISMNKPVRLYGADIPSFSLILTDPCLDLSRTAYSIGDVDLRFGVSTLSNTSINRYYWNGLPSGIYNLTIYAQDTFGNAANRTVTLEKDVTAPGIVIEAPLANSVWGFDAPFYNVTVIDPHFASLTYSLDGGLTRYQASGSSGFIGADAWFNVSKGENHITFYAIDTLGNENSGTVRIYRDEAPPLITIYSPNTGTLIGNTSLFFNISIIDDFLSASWYTIGTSPAKHLLNGTSGTVPLDIWLAVPDGPLVIRFYANDSLGNLASNATLIIKDTVVPGLAFSTSRNLFGLVPISFELYILEPHPCTLYYQIDDQGKVYNLVSGHNEILYSYWQSFASGNHTLYILVNDTLGNTATISYDFTKDTVLPNVTCLSPAPGEQFAFTVPMIDFEIQDMSDIDAIWYTLEDSEEKHPILLNESFVVLDDDFWSGLANGTWVIFIYANDTAGNIGFDFVLINKDILGPIIRFLYPNATFLVGKDVPPIIFTVDDANLNHVWYRIIGSNGFEFRCNPGDYNGTIDAAAWRQAYESRGKVTLRIYADDTLGTTTVFEITFNCVEEEDLRVGLSNFLFRNIGSALLLFVLVAIIASIAAISKKRRLQQSDDRIRGPSQRSRKGNGFAMATLVPKTNTHSLVKFLAIAMITIAALVLLQQYLSAGTWFEVSEFLHRENLAVILVIISIMMLVTALLYRRTNKLGRK
jgi:parallel beta-helix repeat protein